MQEKPLFCYLIILLRESDPLPELLLIFIMVCSFFPMQTVAYTGTTLRGFFQSLGTRSLGQCCNIAQLKKCRFLIHNFLLFIWPLLHYFPIEILMDFHKHFVVFSQTSIAPFTSLHTRVSEFFPAIAVEISMYLTPLYISVL